MTLSTEIITPSLKGFIRDRIAELITKGIEKQNELRDPTAKILAETFIERAIPWAGLSDKCRINVSYQKAEFDIAASSMANQQAKLTYFIDVIIEKAHEEDDQGIIDHGDVKAALELAEMTHIVYMVLMAHENRNLGFPVRIDNKPAALVSNQRFKEEQVFQPEYADGAQINVIGARLVMEVDTKLMPPVIDGSPLLEMLSEFCEVRFGKLGEVILLKKEKNNGD